MARNVSHVPGTYIRAPELKNKVLHVRMTQTDHTAFRVTLARYGFSMQEAVEEFMRACGAGDAPAEALLSRYQLRKARAEIKRRLEKVANGVRPIDVGVRKVAVVEAGAERNVRPNEIVYVPLNPSQTPALTELDDDALYNLIEDEDDDGNQAAE